MKEVEEEGEVVDSMTLVRHMKKKKQTVGSARGGAYQ